MTTYVQGHPVRIVSRTNDSAWVRTLDGKRIETQFFGWTNYTDSGWVSLDELQEDEIDCGCVLPEQQCPACRAAAVIGLEAEEYPY